MDKEIDHIEVFFDNNSDLDIVCPDTVANFEVEHDEINFEIITKSNISVVMLKKAKPQPKLEQNMFEECFVVVKGQRENMS